MPKCRTLPGQIVFTGLQTILEVWEVGFGVGRRGGRSRVCKQDLWNPEFLWLVGFKQIL